MAQSKSGTFVGNGTITTILNVGFEPDIIVIDSGADINVAGFQGLLTVVIVKGVLTLNYYHNSDSDTSERTYNASINSSHDPFGKDEAAYRSYAVYEDGDLAVTNKTNNGNVCFANDQNYSWTAYKA